MEKIMSTLDGCSWPAQRFGLNWLTMKLATIAVWITDQAKFTDGR
jgi:hypothetical protein